MKTNDPTRRLSGCEVLPAMNAPTTTKPSRTPKKTKETGNRFRTINEFTDFSLADLSRAEALTWLVLWRDTKPIGTARTSTTDIARRIGASKRAVVTALSKLKQLDLLNVVHQGGLNRGVSVYRVLPVAQPIRNE